MNLLVYLLFEEKQIFNMSLFSICLPILDLKYINKHRIFTMYTMPKRNKNI
jgi:hypothetical protein